MWRESVMIDIIGQNGDEFRFYYWIGRAECARRTASLAANVDERSGYLQLAVVYEENAARIRRSDVKPPQPA